MVLGEKPNLKPPFGLGYGDPPETFSHWTTENFSSERLANTSARVLDALRLVVSSAPRPSASVARGGLAGISQCAPRLAEVAPWRGDRGRPVSRIAVQKHRSVLPLNAT
jgi:hypothetical protein